MFKSGVVRQSSSFGEAAASRVLFRARALAASPPTEINFFVELQAAPLARLLRYCGTFVHMTWFMGMILFGLALLIPTAYAGYIGAPYAPTRRLAIERAFDLLAVGKGDVVVDLGAGDGKVLLAAAARDAAAIGYELSPIMWLIARLRVVGKKGVKVRWRNFLKAQMPQKTTHIFMFLMPEHMTKLRHFITQQHLPHLKFVLSYSFPIPNLPPLHVVQTDKAGRIFVYAAEDFN